MSTMGQYDVTLVREPARSSTMSPRQTSSHRHVPLPRQEGSTASSKTTDDRQEDESKTALTTSVKRATVVRLQYSHESHNIDDMNWTRVHMSARLPIIDPARDKAIPEIQFPSPNLRDRPPTSTSRHEKHASPSRPQWYATTVYRHKETFRR